MELDELKNIWQSNKTKFLPKGEEEIAMMLKGNSRSVVDNLKKSVWFELIFTLVAAIAFLVYAFNLPEGALKWTTVSILILFMSYTIYYIKKLLLLNRFNTGADHLKATLEKLVENLTSYLKFYRRSYTILYPVYFGLGLLFGGLETGSERFLQTLSNPKIIAYLMIMGGIFFFLSTWFTKWYLKKLYGNHLEKLLALLRELNSFDRTE